MVLVVFEFLSGRLGRVNKGVMAYLDKCRECRTNVRVQFGMQIEETETLI